MNDNLTNICLISDINWNNYILINKKIKKFDAENYRLHRIYTNQTIIEDCCNNNEVYLIRHSGENITNIIFDLTKICDIFIIFTNLIEYLTASSLAIELCKYYNIPYIIVSEYDRENDFYSIKNDYKSFKKFIENIELNSKLRNNINYNSIFNIFNKEEINKYNEYFINKAYKHINLTDDIINKLRNSYISEDNKKKENSIKLLYDKDKLKVEKLSRRHNKEYKQLVFANNRINYYKTSPKRELNSEENLDKIPEIKLND